MHSEIRIRTHLPFRKKISPTSFEDYQTDKPMDMAVEAVPIILAIDIGERLAGAVTDFESHTDVLDRPRRREAARSLEVSETLRHFLTSDFRRHVLLFESLRVSLFGLFDSTAVTWPQLNPHE